ncbi:GAF domain-containing protein [Actinoplanes bogorensis]|uniref:histidine kinase n=1 Tax=Paractinoplanes bogorensis TaxID=1610840 RepID=A0ABS5Z3Q4_9ACTN|nr:ATP-binding protein [Actinoplanes bogorensis]MBU2669045.1 GAF domain-containing protein [Actinoplanes bogorensis]
MTLAAPDRLDILQATGLMDTGPVPSLDRLTRMAARLTGARLALVSLVDTERQRFASGCGLSETLERDRQTPLSHSFCQYVVMDGAPLIIEDGRLDDRLHDNLAIPDLNVIAYAGFPIHAPDGQVLGSFCVTDDKPRRWSEEDLATVRDLAAATESEIALRLVHSEIADDRAFLQALLDSLDTGVAACDSEGRLAFFNHALRQIHGADATPGPPDTWSQKYGLYAADGHTPLAADQVPLARAYTGEVVEGQQLVVPAPDGTPRRFLTNARPIDTADGRRLGAVAAMHEITAVHRSEVLRRTRHAVAQVLSEATSAEQAAAGAVAAVADSLGWLCGEYWQVTEDRREIVRISSHTAPGRSLAGFTSDAPLSFGRGEGLSGMVWRTGAEVWSGGEVLNSMRVEAAREAGIRTVIGLPVRAGRRVLGVIAFFVDADLPHDPDIAAVLDTICVHLGRFVERRRAEDLQLALVSAQHELTRMQDELTALVIHELRNPIGVIRGYMETLLESPDLAETDRRYAGVVDRSAEHLQRLVDDLLDLARLDAGHLSIDPRPMSAGRLLREVIENHRPDADAKQLTVEARLQPHLPVHADAHRLRQALDNLLSNAIKYTPAGGRVMVTAETGGDGVTIEISDTGIGIPAEQYPRLFSRFFRAGNATRAGIKGTGLGLAVTKAIVEAHQGTLAARPAVGGGTTFTVTLPTVEA